MHAVTAVALSLALALAGAAAGPELAGAGPARPAQEDDNCGYRCSYDGGATGRGYSAMGVFAGVVGGGSRTGTPEPCTVNGFPDEPAHAVVLVYGDGEGEDGDQYLVVIQCIADRLADRDWEYWEFPEGFTIIDVYEVVAVPEDEVVERALAAVAAPAPVVTTSPGGGDPALVGTETWFMVDDVSWGRVEATHSEGPVSVRVWAEPAAGARVTWDTGDGTMTCVGSGDPPGSCAHTYRTSSAGQPATDAAGRPAFAVTAGVTYEGGYEVSIYGQVVGGDDDLPDVTRTSDPVPLAVDEAQALVTPAGPA